MKVEALDKAFKARISELDEKHLSPSERAIEVNNIIGSKLNLLNPVIYFDVMCYCVEMLNLYAFSLGDEELLEEIRLVNQRFYSLYYSLPDDSPILGPDRETHLKEWKERL